MKPIGRIITLFLFAGFIGIKFAPLIDDPAHFWEPDPDCPICLAAQTQVCINPDISITFTPEIILYLVEKPLFIPHVVNSCSILEIRAPPSV